MDEAELRERLVRIETKLDHFAGLPDRVTQLEMKDERRLGMAAGVSAIVGVLVTGIGLLLAVFA